jgi:beta-N-acetylhexosaminidase
MRNSSFPITLLLCLALAFCSASEKDGRQTAAVDLTAPHTEAERWAEDTLGTLSLERKVAQMICEQMRGEYAAEDDPGFQYLLRLVKDYGVGCLVLYGGSPRDTAGLLNRLQRESDLPLLITADFEGGPGQQIMGATEFPANMALSATGSEDLAYRLGKAGAAEGRALGIHVTYSPVVDIQTRPENPVLSVRSFGGDLELLGRMAGAYIRGYQENGMLATAKHYPGRGDVDLIPGTEFTANNKPADRVEAEDFLAFKKVIDAGVTYVMSEHIAIPSLTDGSDLPASVNGTLSSYWLRERLGFEGILTSDDLWYAKVTDRFGPVQACVLAVQAGHDAVLKPADVPATIQGLVDAVRSGAIPEEQIDRSVKKILYWKARLNLHRSRFVDVAQIPGKVGIKPHRDLMFQIADQSLTLIKNDGFFPTGIDRLGHVAHISLQKKDNDPAPTAVTAKMTSVLQDMESFYIRRNTADAYYARALEAARKADTVVISLFNQRTTYQNNGPLSPQDLKFLKRVIAAKPESCVVMSYGNPYLAESLKAAAAFVTGYGEGGFYGNQLVYADSFLRLLKGEIVPRGKLPVKVSDSFPMGTGITY